MEFTENRPIYLQIADHHDVPVFFRTMNLLGFTFRELAEWHEGKET